MHAQEVADSNEALAFEDCCSGTEPAVYAKIALVTAGLLCSLCCIDCAAGKYVPVSGSDAPEFPDERAPATDDADAVDRRLPRSRQRLRL